MLWWSLRNMKSTSMAKRKQAADELVAIGESAVPRLIALLPNLEIGDEVVTVLGRIGGVAATEALMRVFRSKESYSSVAALKALTSTRPASPSVISFLVDSMRDSNPAVSFMAANALGGIGGLGWRPENDQERTLFETAWASQREFKRAAQRPAPKGQCGGPAISCSVCRGDIEQRESLAVHWIYDGAFCTKCNARWCARCRDAQIERVRRTWAPSLMWRRNGSVAGRLESPVETPLTRQFAQFLGDQRRS